MSVVVSSNQFKQMQSYKTLEINQAARQKLKWSFIDRIKNNINIRWNRAKKVLSVIDEIIYKATDRGYSFNGRETLADKCKVSLSTVDKAMKLLKQSGEVFVVYRHNPSSNGYKTPIILLKQHEHFTYWNELLGLENSVENKVENADKSGMPMDEGVEKVSTYLLPTLKQEKDDNISIDIQVDELDKKLIKIIHLKVADAVKKGSKIITHHSSYLDKVLHSLEQTAIFEAKQRKKAEKRKTQWNNSVPAPSKKPNYSIKDFIFS